ncbi:UNVERIFIED_CONTAM: hypothetical protein GTU68_021463 [Idotea baltica]|nr:hypothetical protein [Idotea baltica]
MSASSIRIDKWLWACRFFKTRKLAKQNIDGGKVKVNGVRAKPSRELAMGDLVQLRLGWDERTVEVLVLSGQRRGAPVAQTLYAETQESITAREKNAGLRKAGGNALLVSDRRPTKKERRQIHRFKQDI